MGENLNFGTIQCCGDVRVPDGLRFYDFRVELTNEFILRDANAKYLIRSFEAIKDRLIIIAEDKLHSNIKIL